MSDKKIDCLKLKEELQAAVMKEREGLTPDEVIEQTRRDLDSDESIVAKVWRRAKEQKQAS